MIADSPRFFQILQFPYKTAQNVSGITNPFYYARLLTLTKERIELI